MNRQILARKRIPYFERPKQPHDWRYWVGGVGRALIVTGLLMFAFVGYQLWGTGIETARAQDELGDQFDNQLADVTTTTASPDTEPDESLTSTTVPYAPPSTFANGDVIAQIIVPKMELEYYVVEGVRLKDLKKGPGHFKETPLPGQLGNAAIAGHRTTYGHPFYRLDDLHTGDEITIKMVTGGTFVYVVTGKEIVAPNEYARVIPTRDPNVATLTLATCHPVYTSRERLIVYATLDAEKSDPVTRSSQLGRPDAGGLPGEGGGTDQTDITTATTEATTVTESTVAGSSMTSTTEVPATTIAADDDPTGLAEEQDSFAQGWFADTAAWPHVIGWGLMLAVVAVGAFYVGKHFRKLYVAFLVGALPFLLVLYFFFQNVNRLLPPGL